MASSVFQSDVFQGGGVFQMFTPVGIDGVGYGNILDRSPRITFTTLDLTLVDPEVTPGMNDAVVWTHHLDWSGTVVAVEASTQRSGGTDHRWVRVSAKNSEVLEDLGDVGFGLSDDPDDVDTFGYRDLVVQQRYQDTVTETRAQLKTRKDGVYPGYEIAVTSPADDWDEEVCTIMAYSVGFPTWDDPVYELDLGFGVFEDATEGGAPDTPFDQYGDLGRDTFPEYIQDMADNQIVERIRVYSVGQDPGFPSVTSVTCSVGYGQMAVVWGDALPLDITELTGSVDIVASASVPFAYVTGAGTFSVTSYEWAHIVVGPGSAGG